MKSKWGLSIFKNKDGVDFRYFRKCYHFENILFELGAVDYTNFRINTILGNQKVCNERAP
jgi:hypothetical protein